MSAYMKNLLGPGIIVTLLFASVSSVAQDVDDEIGPAVDTSAPTESRESQIDALEPAVSAPVISEDVRRSTAGNRVMDEIELGRSEITGNQELPKVLYIVPWKRSNPGDLLGRPVNTLIDDVLAPIDREEFIRQVDYYDDLYGNEEE